MTHPAWPSTVWQIYSSDYETFGSYFGSLKACEPIHAQYNLHDGKVVIINTTLKTFQKAYIVFKLYNLKGENIFSKTQKVSIQQNQLNECFTPILPTGLPDVYLARLIIKDAQNKILCNNEYWKSTKVDGNFKAFNQLIKVDLTGKVLKQFKGKSTGIEFEVTNNSNTPAIGIKLNLRNNATNERILPAYFSDGYFTLLPGESKIIKFDCIYPGTMNITTDGYNVINKTIISIK
jgi:hypothetical protein